MTVNSLGLSYSLKEFIEAETSIPTLIKYDGIILPEGKPYALVERRPTARQQLSKGRETVTITYRFQLGIYAESHFESEGYASILNDLFLFRDIPYFDEEGALTEREFAIETDFTTVPIMSDDITKKTTYHMFFMDLEINENKHASAYK